VIVIRPIGLEDAPAFRAFFCARTIMSMDASTPRTTPAAPMPSPTRSA